VVDEHSARQELLETAVKTMYGQHPAYHMASPPFEVESHLNQNIQAADWIAAIIGKLWTFRLGGTEWSDIEHYERYFWGRVHALATHSTVMERQKKQTTKIEKETTSAVITMHAGETAIAAAFQKATFKKTSKNSN
jgi:hypothetical protein